MPDTTYKEFSNQIRDIKIDKSCCTCKTIDIFQGKWNIRVLFELVKCDSVRFGELKKQVDGITNTMLTSTLRDLESKGLIDRTQFNEIPPHVEYSLSEAGKDLYPIFMEMMQWHDKYQYLLEKNKE